MGMAASQGRLLSLTARMSDLEFQSQSKCQSKIKLAMSTEDITRTYTEALNKKKFVGLTGFNKNTPEYADLTYDMLTGMNSPLAGDYCLTDSSNRILVTNDMKQKFDGKTLEEFLIAFNANDQVLVSPAVYPVGYTEATYNQTSTQLAASVAAAQAKVDSTPTTRLQNSGENGAQSVANFSKYQAALRAISDAEAATQTFTTSYKDADILKNIYSFATDSNLSDIYAAPNVTTLSNGGVLSKERAEENFNAIMQDVKDKVGKSLVGNLTGQLQNVDSSVLQSAVDVAYQKTLDQFLGPENTTYIQSSSLTPRDSFATGTNNIIETSSQSWHTNKEYLVDMQQVLATFFTYFDQECANYASPDNQSPNTSSISTTTTTRSGANGTGTSNKVTPPPTAAEIAALKAEADKLYNAYVSQSKPSTIANPDYAVAVAELTAAKQSQSAFPQNVTPAVYKGSPESAYYTNIYNRMALGYTTQGDESKTINNKNWLSNQLQNGGLFLEKFNNGKAEDQDLSAVGEINEVRDTTDLDIIEAKYNSDLLAIQTKDKRLDMEIKQIDTEHSAIQTEVESVKKVIQKNIESSFKTFG